MEMLDYLNEHPTAAEILAAVHQVRTKTRRLHPTYVDENSFNQELSSLPPVIFGAPEKPPSDFIDSVNVAQDMMKKMKLVH